MEMEERMSLCRSAIEETLSQIKTLQSKHQQLVGYYQALQDISQELSIEKEESAKKPIKSKATAA